MSLCIMVQCFACLHGIDHSATSASLQVGVTAMLVASKYEEIWAPEVRDFVYISDKAYTREQVSMLGALQHSWASQSRGGAWAWQAGLCDQHGLPKMAQPVQ
jgi:hypothetical protein